MPDAPTPAPITRTPVRHPWMLLAGLIAFAALTRVLPHHVPNLSAVGATALFAGWFFRGRLLAIAAPLGAMLVSDAILGGYHPAVMAVVYASLAATTLLGRLIGEGGARRLLGRAAVGSLAASVLFFVTTNLAVWAFVGVYTPDAAGLGACFASALPFFRFTAGGDLLFTLFLFGTFVLLTRPAAGATEHASAAA